MYGNDGTLLALVAEQAAFRLWDDLYIEGSNL
jgi:hypothetical protein